MFFKKVDYGEVLESSFTILKKNVILFLPNALLLVISFLLISIFFYGSGLSNLIFTKPYLLDDFPALLREFEVLSRTAPFIITLFIWIMGELLFGSFLTVMKFGMIKDVIKTGRTNVKSGLTFAEKNFFNYWTIYLTFSLIIFSPLLILLFVYFLFISTLEYVTLGAILLSLFGIVWLCYAVLMWMRLFFVYPVMTFEKEKYFQSMKHEFHYVKSHTGHTFISLMIFLAIMIGYHVIRESVEIFGIRFQGTTVILFIAIAMAVFEIFVLTFEHVFIFKSYLAGKHIKNLVEKAKKKGDYIEPKTVKRTKKQKK